MSAWLLEWGVPILLTPFGLWVAWKLIEAKERQADYASLMAAYQRARERDDKDEAERLFQAAERRAAL